MCEFIIRYANGKERTYSVSFRPWPTWGMLHALANSILDEKGGKAIEFHGPNGLHGFIAR